MCRIFLWEACGLRNYVDLQKIPLWGPLLASHSPLWSTPLDFARLNPTGDSWDIWIYPGALITAKVIYTCHGAFLCTRTHMRTCIFSCIYTALQKPSNIIKSHLDFFLLSSLLLAISSSHCLCQDTLSPAQLFGLDQEHELRWPLSDGSRAILESFNVTHTGWDNTSNCFTVASNGTQTNVDSYLFCYWNQRWK